MLMPAKIALKNLDWESRLIQRRIGLAGVAVALLFLIVLLRIVYLQVLEHEHYTTLSQDNRVKLVAIPPIRGLIFSQDNVLLAENRPSFTLEVVPEKVPDLDSMLARISELIVIKETDIRRFREQLKRKRRFEGVPLRFNLNDEEVARVAVNQHRLAGIDIIARLNRHYPRRASLAHGIGYVGMIDETELGQLDKSNYRGTKHIGKTGVERAYEDILHGQVGYQQVEVNAQGRIIRVLDRTAPVPGNNLRLTVNAGLQQVAVTALQGKRGAIVALDPNTGGILTAVSSPGYDPNLFVNGIDSASYRALLQSADAPLLNRFSQGNYPPGSTIKPFIGLAALDLAIRESGQETWCRGWYSLQGSSHRYRDWKKNGHGHTDMTKAIAESCDVYFYTLANDMGVDTLHEVLADFGFGRTTGLDIGSESAGLLPSRAWKQRRLGQPWYPGETLIFGIGQGWALVTPLQLAVATAAVANQGKLYQPHLLAAVTDPLDGAVIDRFAAHITAEIQVTELAYWQEVINAMHEVVQGESGTARRSGRGAPYAFAGKTGTAQVISIGQDEEYDADELPEELHDHALFVGFAPLKAPTIAVAVIIENGGSGASTAAPVARRLFDHYLLGEVAEHDRGDQG